MQNKMFKQKYEKSNKNRTHLKYMYACVRVCVVIFAFLHIGSLLKKPNSLLLLLVAGGRLPLLLLLPLSALIHSFALQECHRLIRVWWSYSALIHHRKTMFDELLDEIQSCAIQNFFYFYLLVPPHFFIMSIQRCMCFSLF